MIIGLIPARSGSKTIPDKNIKLLAGYPLIAYSIVASKLSSGIDRTIVSTDSEEYAKIAISYGAGVPFLRPPEISKDTSTDMEFVEYLLDWCNWQQYQPDYIVHLSPTVPLRDPAMIDSALNFLSNKGKATSLRSVHAGYPVYKEFTIQDGFLIGFFPDYPAPEYYNLPRQTFPPTYQPDGYVDILKTKVVNSGTLHGSRILPFIVPDVGDLDTLEDFEFIEWRLQKYGSVVYDYLKSNFKEEK